MALPKVLCRGAPCQGLVRADGVVDALPVAQGLTGAGQIQVSIVAFPELLGMGLLGPFDVAIELRRAGRQDEEADTCLPTGFLEVGHELRAAVHLNGVLVRYI